MLNRHHKPIKITRDLVLFISGLMFFWHEALIYRGQEPRIYLMMIAVGMMGLPVYLRQDEKKREE